MSEKKGIDVGGGITLDDDEFATTPGLDFSISKNKDASFNFNFSKALRSKSKSLPSVG